MIVKMLAAEVINKEINKCVTTEACLAPRPSDHRGPLLSVLSSGEAKKTEDTSSLPKGLISESYTEIDFFFKSHVRWTVRCRS